MATSGLEAFPPHIVALARQGGRIGLLGGSFNPAHGAHLHISLIAMRRLKLDAVWWIVSPQNPLKPVQGMAPLEKRLLHATRVALHPRIAVSAPETALNTVYTADTIRGLQTRFPTAAFVWVMGGDSLVGFHRWKRWAEIFDAVPIAVVARPGSTVRALNSVAGVRFRRFLTWQPDGLAQSSLPAWTFIQERLDPASATAIRAQGGWV